MVRQTWHDPTRRNRVPKRGLHGTSREYLLDRLRRAGRPDLVEAVEAGLVSAFAVAVEMGWMRRPAPLGTGSTNQAKRREFRLAALIVDEAREGET
jgi:hypothetical protein